MNDPINSTIADGQDKTFAIFAHLGGLFTSWLAPLIIYLIKKDDPNFSFATDQAKEALNYQITLFFVYIICFILFFVLIGIFLLWIVVVTNLIFCIIASVKSSNGIAYRYPINLRLIK